MKDSANHPLLWQKRNEWPINDNVQADWQQMQSLLDVHMPVSGGAAGNGGASAGGTATGGSTGLAGGIAGGIKLIAAVIVTLSAAAIIYYTVSHNKKSAYRDKQTKQQTEQVSGNNEPTNSTEATAKQPENTGGTSSVSTPGNGVALNNNSSPSTVANTPGTSSGNTTTTGSNANVDGQPVNTVINNKANNTVAGKPDLSSKTASGANANNSTGSKIVGSNSIALSKANSQSAVTAGNTSAVADKNIPGQPTTSHTVKSMSNAVVKTQVSNSITKVVANAPVNSVATGSTKGNALVATNTHAIKSRTGRHVKPVAGSAISGSASYGSLRNNGFGTVNPIKLTKAGLNKNTRGGYNQSGQSNKLYDNTIGKDAGGGINGTNPDTQIAATDNNRVALGTPIDEPQYYGTPMEAAIPHFTPLDKTLKTSIKDAPKNVHVTTAPPVAKPQNTNTQKLELGILAGVNAPGSFTDKSQNANIYGSLPVDAFLGVFANYTAYKNWGINIQPKMLSPQTVSGTYSHIAVSKVDSGKTFVVTDSRKVYFVDVPLHIVYNATPNIRLMAGAAMSFPVKDANGSALLVPNAALKDSAYYVGVRKTISATKYSTQPSFGLSGGVSFYYWRLYLNATYLKALKPESVSSDLGSYTFNHDALQFSLGIRLK